MLLLRSKKNLKLDQTNVLSTIFIVALLSLALFSPWSEQVGLANFSVYKGFLGAFFSGFLLLVCLCLPFLRRTYNPYTVFHLSWLKLSFLLLFVLGATSIFWTINIAYTISAWTHWFIALGTFVAAYHLPVRRITHYQLSWGLLGAGFLIAVIGVLQYWWNPFTLFQYASPAATFGNKNIASHVVVLILPVSIYLFTTKYASPRQTWLIGLMTLVILLYITYTQTRSSWVAISVEICLFGGFLYICRHRIPRYIHWGKKKKQVFGVCLCLLLLLINMHPTGWVWFFSAAGERLSSESSVTARLEIWAITLEMIKDSPMLGSGLGTWYQNQVQEGFARPGTMSFVRVHNDVLELWTDLGLVGVVLLLAGSVAITHFVFTLLRAGKVETTSPSEFAKVKLLDSNVPESKLSDNLFYVLLWIGLAGSFAQMQFTFPYQEPVPMFLLGLYIGLSARYSENYIPAIKVISVKIPKSLYLGFVCLCLILSMAVTLIHFDWLKTHRQLSLMARSGVTNEAQLPQPWLDHRIYHGVLRIMSASFTAKKSYPDVVVIEENLLSKWPNDNLGWTNLINALIALEQYDQALIATQELQKVSVEGFYYGQIFELFIYHRIGQSKKLIGAFQSLLAKDKALLAQDLNTYRNLLTIAVNSPSLNEAVPYLYQQSIASHPYHCPSENYMADYYWSQKAYAKAAQHLNNTERVLGNECIDPKWPSLLEQKSLAILLR